MCGIGSLLGTHSRSKSSTGSEPLGKENMGTETLKRIETLDDLGAALRKARKAAGLTLTEAAHSMGVGRRLLTELENGNRNAGIESVLRIVQLLGLDLFVNRRGQPVLPTSPRSHSRGTDA